MFTSLVICDLFQQIHSVTKNANISIGKTCQVTMKSKKRPSSNFMINLNFMPIGEK